MTFEIYEIQCFKSIAENVFCACKIGAQNNNSI